MPRFLAAVSGALNHLDIPFLFKCRDDPNQYDRTDAALLVVSRRYLAITLRLLGQLDGLFDEVLKPGIPLFTRELRPGIGLADNPSEAVSFGQLRCTLLAQGLVEALIAGRQGREARHQTVADCFARAGLDPSRPHLKPGSSDQYHRPDGESWRVDLCHTGPPRLGLAKEDAFLDVADRIGRRLCRDAIWSGGRCNWMTWTVQTFSGRYALVHRAAPPGLFDGVTGIALFLAHLWRLTGDRQQGDALGGAIRQLLANAPKTTSLGFTDGRRGVGHALVAIGRLLEDDDLIEAGIGLREASGPLAGSPTDVTDWPSLSRIRQLVGTKAGLTAEIDATLRSASLSLSSADASDLSLGRGLAGHADFLLEAAGTLNRPDLRLVAEQFGRAIVEQFHRPDLPWPCGVPGAGETPDLMTGTAGIGLTFLRLRDPASVPSPFLLQPMGG